VIRHVIPAHATHVMYAYFAPYDYNRHLQLVGRCARDPRVHVSSLGLTLDGRDLDLLEITDRSPEAAAAAPIASRRKVWVIARQHPGESMAEWLVEGMLDRLLDWHDPIATSALRQCVFYVMPNINPDGERTTFHIHVFSSIFISEECREQLTHQPKAT
jgi:murein tripeptide amidase MpaA